MIIRYVEIANFLGIKRLNWKIDGRICCLVGAGDSCKSTILKAIEYCLWTRYYLNLNDLHFHNGDVSDPIDIRVTITDFPEEFLTDSKFGLFLRGIQPDGSVIDEPVEGCIKALTIRLTVDDSLEPSWTVYRDSNAEGRAISAKDRQALGVAILSEETDRQFTWGKGSALSRITENESGGIGTALAEVNRIARKHFSETPVVELTEASSKAKGAIDKLGFATEGEYSSSLDIFAVSQSTGAMCLNNNNIPLKQFGFGSRKLAALALQQFGIKNGAISLIDEIERGLEPHRICQLINHLNKSITEEADEDVLKLGQCILATHSPTVIRELDADSIYIVKKDINNHIAVQQCDSSLQPILRAIPEAILAKKVLLCEGRTEYGMCRSLVALWQKWNGDIPITHKGAIAVDAGGDAKACDYALKFKKLGYASAVLLDSDNADIVTKKQELIDNGITVIDWTDEFSTEKRLLKDLPWEAVKDLLRILFKSKERNNVVDLITGCYKDLDYETLRRHKLSDWNNILKEEDLREIISELAMDKKWFKSIPFGMEIGRIIIEHYNELEEESDLSLKLIRTANWIYND